MDTFLWILQVVVLVGLVCFVVSVIGVILGALTNSKAREKAEIEALKDLPKQRHYKPIEPGR